MFMINLEKNRYLERHSLAVCIHLVWREISETVPGTDEYLMLRCVYDDLLRQDGVQSFLSVGCNISSNNFFGNNSSD
jgi:hypothetical protein